MGIMRGLRKTKRDTVEVERPVATRLPETPPQLMLLLPDAGGIATYALNQFPSAKAAEFFLDSTLRGQLGEGSVLFWALTRKPVIGGVGGVDVEPLVIIRDVKRAIVYPFSFSDLESAEDFVRHEMRRGLDLGQVMVFWAVPARIEVDFWGRSTIIPPAPPQRYEDTHGRAEYEFAPSASFAPVAEPPTLTPVPAAEPDDAAYLTDSDIAETVAVINQITGNAAAPEPVHEDRVRRLPVSDKTLEGPGAGHDHEAEVIDFPSASQKLHDTRNAKHAWHNFSLAVDEALDARAVQEVSIKLAWNRLVRAIAEAADQAEYVRVEADADAERQRIEAERQRAIDDELEAERLEAERKSAIVKSWSNIGVAMHEGVGERTRQVSAIAVGNVVTGLRDSFELAAARQSANISAVGAIAEALAAAAHAAERRRDMRKAWLNIAWTLEEACYAHALEQKARSVRAWRRLTAAIIEGAVTQEAHYASLRLGWSNASYSIGEALDAQFAHLQLLQRAWSGATREVAIAARLKIRIGRQTAGIQNFLAALSEAHSTYAYNEELTRIWGILSDEIADAVEAMFVRERALAAWGNTALALDEVCRAYVKKQKMAIRTWSRLATAFAGALDAKIRKDAAITTWTNVGIAMHEFCAAKATHDGAVAAWNYAGIAVAEAVAAHVRREGLIAAWTNAGAVFREAVHARERHIFFCNAWGALTVACDHAVKLMIARQAAMELSWMRLTAAFNSAVHARMFRDASIAAWANAASAFGEVAAAYAYQRSMIRAWTNAAAAIGEAVPAYFFRQRAIASWTNATVAFKEAVVAEAKLRIAEAGLDKTALAEVEKTVKAAQKAVRDAKTAATVEVEAQVNGRAAMNGSRAPSNGKRGKIAKAPEVETFPATIAEEPTVNEMKLRHSVAVDVTQKRAQEVKVAEEPITEPTRDDAVEADDLESESDTTGGWRLHDARWEPRTEPFRGFQSPPGRFYRKEREDQTPGI